MKHFFDFVISLVLIVAIIFGAMTFVDAMRRTEDRMSVNIVSKTISLEYTKIKMDHLNFEEDPYEWMVCWWELNVLEPMFKQ